MSSENIVRLVEQLEKERNQLADALKAERRRNMELTGKLANYQKLAEVAKELTKVNLKGL